MKVWTKNNKKDARLVRYRPILPRVYFFAGITRLHWLQWCVYFDTGIAEEDA